MKIRFFKLALAAVLLGGMISCVQEEPTRVPAKMDLENADELGASPLTFSNRAETKTVNFTADGDWYIRIPKECDWLTVSPKEGTGDAAVTFTSTLYEEDVPRSAKVYFVVDGIEQKDYLQVTQLQKFYLEPSVLSNVLPKTGGESVVSVNTNGTFTCEVTSGSDWLSVVSQDRNEVVINAKAISENAVKNSAVLTFKCVEDAGLTATLNLSQKNLQITIDAKEIYTSAYRGSGEVGVKLLNVTNWKAESNDSWLKAERVGDKLAFEVLERNPLGVARVGSIAAVCTDSEEDSDVKGVIEVIQNPGADLIDFVFNQDGTAYDASPLNNPVQSQPEGAAYFDLCDAYGMWGPTVEHGENKSPSSGYWKAEYTPFIDKIEDGYTMEAIFKINMARPAKPAETKAFSATGSGGFAIMLGNTNATYGSKNTIQFIQHSGVTGNTWRMAVTDILPVVGQVYHVFGVWDKEAGVVKCYVDGKLAGTKECPTLKHMTTNKKVLTVCANHTDSGVNGSWNGSVYAARMYDKVLTDEEIANRSMLDNTSHSGSIIVK